MILVKDGTGYVTVGGMRERCASPYPPLRPWRQIPPVRARARPHRGRTGGMAEGHRPCALPRREAPAYLLSCRNKRITRLSG